MNENLFASFIILTITGLPIVILIIIFPSILFPTPNRLIKHIISIQKRLVQITSKQITAIHNHKINKSTRTITTFIYTYYTTLNRSRHGSSPMGRDCNYRLSSQTHFLPQGTPVPLISILVIIETISLFIQSITLAVHLTANITAGHLLIHLIGGATLALLNISTATALITFIILIFLTILEFAVAIIQAYIFILLPTNKYLNNISVMMRHHPRKHFPMPSYTNCSKRTLIWNNPIIS
eukprot:bmy_05500T0